MIEAVSGQTRQITDDDRWDLLQKKAQEVRVLRAFALFRAQGVEPILIKGLAAGRFYPDSKTRHSADIDLAVSAADFETGYAIPGSPGTQGLAIDVHRELRHLDTAEWNDLFENSELIDIEGGQIRVLRPEDHLRVLCVHWLSDGGSNKDRLWDIYYAIDNRPGDFDWERFLDLVDSHRRRWLICTIGLAHRYLGLEIDDTPIASEARDLPAWLINTVEREWARETRALPMEIVLGDPKMLVKQITKRMRPNPIWATVQMEGSFDARTRVFYQIGNFFWRIPSSYRRVSATLRAGQK